MQTPRLPKSPLEEPGPMGSGWEEMHVPPVDTELSEEGVSCEPSLLSHEHPLSFGYLGGVSPRQELGLI